MVKTKEEILSLARKRFAILQTESSDNRKEALEDTNFTYNIGDAQWPEDERNKRTEAKLPFLTHNKVGKFVAQVANRERDSRMSQRVKPVDDKADPVVAEILTGYIHSIEYRSVANEIYTKAGEQALAGGFGYWRILTEYAEDSVDEQEIFIKHIENQFSVSLHPKEEYGFIREAISKDDFKEKYPDAEPIDFDLQGVGEEYSLWFEEDKIFISEYFYKEPVEKTIAKIKDTSDINRKPETVELEDGVTKETLEAKGFEVLKTRKFKSHVVKWCKITANDIIEGFEDGKVRDWVGKDIPIIEVVGEEINIAGKVHKRSLIRPMKDPQMMYNYGITTLTVSVGLTPKTQTVLTTAMIGPHKAMWDESLDKHFPYLLVEDTPFGMPKRLDPPPVDPGVVSMIKIGDSDIQDTRGMYASSFGEQSNERTGKAIDARSARSDMGTYHFVDNLGRAIEKTARQLIDIVPKIIDTQRLLRIRDYKGKETLVVVNEVVVENDKAVIKKNLSVGKFDVEGDVKIWSTRREEAAQGMRESMQYAPMIAPIIAKHYFKYSDFPGANEIEEDLDKFMKNQEIMARNEQAIKAGGIPPNQTQGGEI